MIQRRALLVGLGAMFAAPVIVRAASLMPVRGVQVRFYSELDLITREAVKLFKESNAFLHTLNAEYRRDFEFYSGHQWPVGSTLRVRLPPDYSVRHN